MCVSLKRPIQNRSNHARIGMVIIAINKVKNVLSPGFAKNAEMTNSIINTTIAIKLRIAMICLELFFILTILSETLLNFII